VRRGVGQTSQHPRPIILPSLTKKSVLSSTKQKNSWLFSRGCAADADQPIWKFYISRLAKTGQKAEEYGGFEGGAFP
jgi:hypothetical protein